MLTLFSGLDYRLQPYADATLRLAAAYGIGPVTVTSVRRSRLEQAQLYNRYVAAVRAGTFPSAAVPYPAAPPGQSKHEYGMAWDSTVPPAQLARWVALRRWVGWEVPSDDPIHAEVP